ncbi:CLC_0170 family protein [Paenibacillus aestuarii]|uniref:CLC_0170 family protein n=1 Tax=Paenibacillus aestuarii TaxID=516965 RepID=A0ABW0K2P1_9BACL|nr:CLC_0170 family protein [Paenibacillus aestuarii]
MASGLSIGYIQFMVLLLWITGALMLRFDLKYYQLKKEMKEAKVTSMLGWMNIVLGCIAFIGNWIYQKMW